MTAPAAAQITLEQALEHNAVLQRRVEHLTNELAQLKRMIFGQKRERHVPTAESEEQLTIEGLFEQLGKPMPGFAQTKERITYERRKSSGCGRKAIPDDLHREKHVLDIAESEKVCSCCGNAKKHIGDDITEELEYKPAVFFVNQFIRPKYVCPRCPQNGVTTAALPPRAIDKGIPGPGLLSYVIVSKHVDHLPLYRLEQIFKRYDITISRSTMDGWLASICVHLEALYLQMQQQLVGESFLVQADETRLRVQDESVIDKCALGYLWPYVGDGKLAVFEFCDSRSRDGPTTFLDGFTDRYLMSDGYAGYNEVLRQNRLKHLMCWAHARRKFFEAKEQQPVFVDQVLTLIRLLYDVEREAAELTPQQRRQLRQEKSALVLEQLKTLLEQPGTVMLPKGDVGDAIAYTLGHWKQLTLYLEDGRLPIDNNLVENTIRPIALGRKNWLFAGSFEGARRLAIFNSFTATCKLNGINPYEYFVNVLPILPSYPASRIAELSPLNWKAAKSN